MSYWETMVLCDLWVPLAMLLCAPMMKQCADDYENDAFGYRTVRSRRNQDTWRFANEYAGTLWQKWGGITLAGTVVAAVALYFLHADAAIWSGILTGVQLVIIFGSIFAVEHALKEKFDENGRRKQ